MPVAIPVASVCANAPTPVFFGAGRRRDRQFCTVRQQQGGQPKPFTDFFAAQASQQLLFVLALNTLAPVPQHQTIFPNAQGA